MAGVGLEMLSPEGLPLFYRIAIFCQGLLICSNIMFIIIIDIITIIAIIVMMPDFFHTVIVLQAGFRLGQDLPPPDFSAMVNSYN